MLEFFLLKTRKIYLWVNKRQANLFFPFRIFSFVLAFFLGGVLLSSFLNLDFFACWPVFLFSVSLFFLVSFLNLILKNRAISLLSFSALFFVLGLSYYSYFDSTKKADLPFGVELEMVGSVASLPQKSIRTQSFNFSWDNLPDRLLLVQTDPRLDLYYGDKIKVIGKLSSPSELQPGYQKYLKSNLILGLVSNSNTEVLNRSHGLDKLKSVLLGLPPRLSSAINKSISEPYSSLAAGILFGTKSALPDELLSNLQKTGLTHIIALSGFNITILAVTFAGFFTYWIGRRLTFFLGVFSVLLFVVATGGSASLVRAAIFSTAILFGQTIGRLADSLNLILLTALGMVLFNPYLIRYDLGFQLSFLAFCGLVFISPVIKSRLKCQPGQKIKTLLAETLSAEIAVTPLVAFSFGMISLVAPLANLMVVWLIPYVMAFSFLVCLGGLISPILGGLLGLSLWPLTYYIVTVVNKLSTLPLAYWKWR